MIENAISKVGGVLAKALQPFRYGQDAGFAVDHTVLGKIDGVLEIEIGKDDI